jgi:hypothetical protein
LTNVLSQFKVYASNVSKLFACPSKRTNNMPTSSDCNAAGSLVAGAACCVTQRLGVAMPTPLINGAREAILASAIREACGRSIQRAVCASRGMRKWGE